MELILFGVGFVAVLATIVMKSDKRNPRMAGNRLMNKGLLVFAVGWLMIVLGTSGASIITEVIHKLGFVVGIIGFVLAVIGWIKHVKLAFRHYWKNRNKTKVQRSRAFLRRSCHCR